MPKKLKIEYRVTFQATVTLNDGEDLSDVIADIDIPEGGLNNSVYKNDSFELLNETELGDNGKMTYRELLDQLNKLTSEQLDCDLTVEFAVDHGFNECFQAELKICGEDHDCLDDNHPVIFVGP